MEGQDEFIMRNSDDADVGFREAYEEVLADVSCNTDLYVVNQESTDLLREVHTGDASFALHRSRPDIANQENTDPLCFQSRSLD